MDFRSMTDDDKRAVYMQVIDLMTEGRGRTACKACTQVGISASVFYKWRDTLTTDTFDAHALYMHANRISCLLEADDIVDVASVDLDNPRTNEYGVDKGHVEAVKVKASIRQWRLNGRTRMFIDQQEDQLKDAKKDLGAITVNLIRDHKDAASNEG